MSPLLTDAIDKVLRDADVPVTNQSEALRYIIRDWLISRGYLTPSPLASLRGGHEQPPE